MLPCASAIESLMSQSSQACSLLLEALTIVRTSFEFVPYGTLHSLYNALLFRVGAAYVSLCVETSLEAPGRLECAECIHSVVLVRS